MVDASSENLQNMIQKQILTIGSKKRLTKTQNKKVHFEDDVPLKSKRILKEMTSLIANADINDQE